MLLALLVWPCAAIAQESAQDVMRTQTLAVLDGLDWTAAADIRVPLMEDAPLLRDAAARIASGETIDAQTLLEEALRSFLSALSSLGSMMVVLMLPALLAGAAQHLLGVRGGEAGRTARGVCFLLIVTPVVVIVTDELAHARDTITSLTAQMDGMLPLLLTLLTALGGSASSAFLHPMVVAASGSMVFLSREVILRLVMCTCAVTTVNHLSGGAHLTRMAQLLRGAVCWLLGVSFTVFLGAMSLQGVCSASIDGVTIRAAKYAVDNFVPVVGGMFSDTMDTLIGCTLIVKNALGVAAVFVLLSAVLLPLMRTTAVVFVMKLSAALLEPVADAQIVRAIGDFSRTIVLFLITMLCVGTMYFLLIVQILLVGNLTVMLR